MSSITQSYGQLDVSSLSGFAYTFTIDYAVSEGDLTADTFAAKIIMPDGAEIMLTVLKAFATFTRLTITHDGSAEVGTNHWQLIRTTNLIPALEFAGKWAIDDGQC